MFRSGFWTIAAFNEILAAADMKPALQMKLNPPTCRLDMFHTPQAYFTLQSNISPTRKGGFSWKRQVSVETCRFLAEWVGFLACGRAEARLWPSTGRSFTPGPFESLPFLHNKTLTGISLWVLRLSTGYKKDIFALLRMDSNSRKTVSF